MTNQSESIKELATALNRAQAKLEGASKDATNPFYKSKYADLQSVFEAIKGPFLENGLSVCQTTEYSLEAGICVVTTLMHVSGEWIKGSLPIRPLKDEPQAIGSAISYSRRYALAAICGVYQKDDDAEAAQARDDSSHSSHVRTDTTTDVSSGNVPTCSVCGAKMSPNKNGKPGHWCFKCWKEKKDKAAKQDDLPF